MMIWEWYLHASGQHTRCLYIAHDHAVAACKMSLFRNSAREQPVERHWKRRTWADTTEGGLEVLLAVILCLLLHKYAFPTLSFLCQPLSLCFKISKLLQDARAFSCFLGVKALWKAAPINLYCIPLANTMTSLPESSSCRLQEYNRNSGCRFICIIMGFLNCGKIVPPLFWAPWSQ